MTTISRTCSSSIIKCLSVSSSTSIASMNSLSKKSATRRITRMILFLQPKLQKLKSNLKSFTRQRKTLKTTFLRFWKIRAQPLTKFWRRRIWRRKTRANKNLTRLRLNWTQISWQGSMLLIKYSTPSSLTLSRLWRETRRSWQSLRGLMRMHRLIRQTHWKGSKNLSDLIQSL